MCFAKYDKELYAQIIEELDNTKWSGDDECHNLLPSFSLVRNKQALLEIKQYDTPFGIRLNLDSTWTVYAIDKDHNLSWDYATYSRAIAHFKRLVDNSILYSPHHNKFQKKNEEFLRNMLSAAELLGKRITHYVFLHNTHELILRTNDNLYLISTAPHSFCSIPALEFYHPPLISVEGVVSKVQLLLDSYCGAYRGIYIQLDSGRSISFFCRYEEFGYPRIYKLDVDENYFIERGMKLYDIM